MPDGLADDPGLHVGRHGNVDYFNGFVGQQIVNGGVAARDAARFGHRAGMSRIARGDGRRIEAGLAVGDQMAVAHDEPGTDAADGDILVARQTRPVIQHEIQGRG